MKAISETYGEILPESMQKLLKLLKLTEEDIFIDLGSGQGKVVIQTFLNTPVKAAIGLELNPHLHQQALSTQTTLMSDHSKLNDGCRELKFINGDFLSHSFEKASVALVASPCFGPSILNPLGKRLNDASTIHTVMSLRPIPSLKRLCFKKIVRVECSWDTALCYIYSH